MTEKTKSTYGYGKRPLWQWVAIYLVIGAVVYGVIYFILISRKGGYSYGANTGGNVTGSTNRGY